MSQYIAKKATLDIKKECSNRSCRCYTEKGYYIRYANRNVDSVLFVCEECFERKYRNQCVVQDFTVSEEPIYHARRVEIDHPTLRRIIRGFNKLLRFANACTKKSKFNTEEIRKVLFTNLGFMTLFALLDYFLIP